MKADKKLKNIRIVLVTHEYATGPAHALDPYLCRKGSHVLFIGHPFHFATHPMSHYHISLDRIVSEERVFPNYFHNEILNVIKDIFLTCWWVMRYGASDIYIGVDGVNAVTGLVLRSIGLTKKVIFYTIDYTPVRYKNSFLNRLYFWLDRTAVIHSDVVWNLSIKMSEEREKNGIPTRFRKKQIVVPMGTEGNIVPVPFKQVRRFHVAHMGHLIPKQGVAMLIHALSRISKKIPAIHIDILGGGEEESNLKILAKTLNVSHLITFHGYIKNHDDLIRRLSLCAVGVAPYEDAPDNCVRNTDSGKVKAYLDAGLPVIVTKVPEIWKELEYNKAGIGVDYTEQSLADAVIKLLSDTKILRQYHEGARILAKKYRWENIFSDAFKSVDLIA